MFAYVAASDIGNDAHVQKIENQIKEGFRQHLLPAGDLLDLGELIERLSASDVDAKGAGLSVNYNRVVVRWNDEDPSKQLVHVCFPKPEDERQDKGKLPLYVVGQAPLYVAVLANFLGKAYLLRGTLGQIIHRLKPVRTQVGDSNVYQWYVTSVTVRRSLPSLVETRTFLPKSKFPLELKDIISGGDEVIVNEFKNHEDWEFAEFSGRVRDRAITLYDSGVLKLDITKSLSVKVEGVQPLVVGARDVFDRGLLAVGLP